MILHTDVSGEGESVVFCIPDSRQEKLNLKYRKNTLIKIIWSFSPTSVVMENPSRKTLQTTLPKQPSICLKHWMI